MQNWNLGLHKMFQNEHQLNVLHRQKTDNECKKEKTNCSIKTHSVFSPVLLWYVKQLLSVKGRR